jgi:hypothetical protein
MEGTTAQKGFTAQAIATAKRDWRVEPSLKDSRRASCSAVCIAVQCSAVQLQGSLAVNMFGAPRAARAFD